MNQIQVIVICETVIDIIDYARKCASLITKQGAFDKSAYFLQHHGMFKFLLTQMTKSKV